MFPDTFTRSACRLGGFFHLRLAFAQCAWSVPNSLYDISRVGTAYSPLLLPLLLQMTASYKLPSLCKFKNSYQKLRHLISLCQTQQTVIRLKFRLVASVCVFVCECVCLLLCVAYLRAASLNRCVASLVFSRTNQTSPQKCACRRHTLTHPLTPRHLQTCGIFALKIPLWKLFVPAAFAVEEGKLFFASFGKAAKTFRLSAANFVAS